MSSSREDFETSSSVESVEARPGYAALRIEKRKLLAEQKTRWAEGQSVSPEEMLQRWPTNPHDDSDVASVLFEDLLQRRARGEDPNLDEYSQKFPEHKHSLGSLISRQDFLRSVGAESTKPRCTLRFPEVGDELCGFRFRAELGRGAFARVFLAEQIELAGRAVAVKVSAIEGNEPQTLAQMQHTHIMPIYAVQDDYQSGLRAVCMPYFGGASLSCILQQLWADTNGPVHGEQLATALERVQTPSVPPRNQGNTSGIAPVATNETKGRTPLAQLRGENYFRAVAWLIARLAEGLQHAHQRGFLHRDIKPANILLGADGQPMLLDFNLSQDQNGDPAEAVLGGTVAYMAPEHLRAMSRRTAFFLTQVDHRSDIYSLGMVLYEMLTGKKPFEQSASYSVVPLQLEAMAAERGKGALSARSVRPDVPWSLESILRKCLAPNPAHRYQQAEHLAEDLRCLQEDWPLQHAPELSHVEQIAKWTRRHPRLTYAGSVALIAGSLLLATGFALAGVQKHLVGTQEVLGLAQSRERKRDFEAGTKQSLCLVNITVGSRENLLQGTKVCENTLALYDTLSGETWKEPTDWACLSREERHCLAEDTRELLLLLAAARVRTTPRNPTVLRQALELLDRAESIPDLSPSRALSLDRSQYLEALGEHEQAQTAKRKAQEIPVATARDHYQLASALARAGTPSAYALALTELDKALFVDPRHYWSWLQRGIYHTEIGELVLAAGDFGHCNGLWPEFAYGHFNLGYVQTQGGKLSEAVICYTRALGCDPALVEARVNRGLAYLESKRYSEALGDLDLALAQGRTDPNLHASRGMALEALGQHGEADSAFRRAFSQSVALPDAVRLRMRGAYGFAVVTRLPKEARRAFEDVLEADPQNKESLYGLALLAMSQGDGPKAIGFFDKALEAAPQFFDARRYRAVQLAREGDMKRASEDINECLARDPRKGDALYAAACVAALASQQLANPKLAEQAIVFLEKAFAQGVGPDKVETDPDLAGLRAQPEIWQRVLQTKAALAPRN